VLKERKTDPIQAELSAAMMRTGELTMQNEFVMAAREEAWPLDQAEIVHMSQTVSPYSEATYGVERVCVV
jgi:hypothetical protein